MGDKSAIRRAVILLLDGVGVGALPDAADYGDNDANTLGNIYRSLPNFSLPVLECLGLSKILSLPKTNQTDNPRIKYELPSSQSYLAWGKLAEVSPGKDTTTGHWELMGVVLSHSFPVYPQGFPAEIIDTFCRRIGRPIVGNRPASGTEIIQELGPEHLSSGYPIVYTSADSVFQIAAHEEVIPPEELYRYCRIAREILRDKYAVARVIARPFRGGPGNFWRTSGRHDYSLPPPGKTLLDLLEEAGILTIGIGKIKDIFAERGVTRSLPTVNNQQGMEYTEREFQDLAQNGLIFTNLIDFDMLYGHRNDIQGFARSLQEFDRFLGNFLSAFGKSDILLITADHGNDPTTPSTDHSREYVPLIVYQPGVKIRQDLGIRATFADVAASLSVWFGLTNYSLAGKSFLSSAIFC